MMERQNAIGGHYTVSTKGPSQTEGSNALDALIQKARENSRHGSLKYFIRKKALIGQCVNRYKVA